ncbi:MAG: HEAT repeat domain-containing protein [Anaerolineae bacterium]|nr:HEAT repeat domain-containing protein [Anaerolineae bacterium]
MRLATDLKNAGINVWLDRLDLHTAEEWQSMLSSALTYCAAFLPILSPDYIASDYGQAEIAQITGNNRAVIPVLLRYIKPVEWPVGIEYDDVVDFTEWQDADIYEQRLIQLIDIVKSLPVVDVTGPVHPQKRYVAQLHAYIEQYKATLEYIPLSYPYVDHTRDNFPHTVNETAYRPAPSIESTWDLDGPFILRYAPLAEPRYMNTLDDALEQYPRLVLVGDYGSGKTSALHALILKMGTAYIENVNNNPMPLLLELSEWQPEETLEAFIQRNWPWRVDIWEEFRAGNVAVYCDGLDEMGHAAADHLAELRDWLNSEKSPKICIFACRDSAYSDVLNLNLPVVSIEDMTPSYTEQFIYGTLGEDAGDELLDRLAVDDASMQRWYWALHNKLLLRALMYVYQHSPQGELPPTPALLIEQVMTLHWQREQLLDNPDWVPLEDMADALTKLAYAILEEDRPHSVPYTYAVEQLGGERMLRAVHSASLLIVNGDYVRFFHPAMMHACAARRLLNDSWHPRLSQPIIDSNGNRIAQTWDGVFLALSGTLDQPDMLIRAIADVDPYLGVQCISVAHGVSSVVRRQTIARLLQLAVDRDQVRSYALLQSLALASPDLLEPVLDLMRDGIWAERQLATDIAMHLDLPTSADVVDALKVWNGSMDTAIATYLRQIGQEALPPLMRLLTAEDPTRRRGAVWALGEMRDRAVVPALIAALQDADPMVRRESAVALRLMPDSAAVDSLLHLLRDESWQVRKAAAEALVDVGATAIPALIRMSQDERADVRRIAIGVLGRVGDASAVQSLLPYLEDENADIRAMSVTALGQIGDESAADGVAALLDETETPRWSDISVGEMAKRALEKIGTEKSMALMNRLRLPMISHPTSAQLAKEKLESITRKGAEKIADLPPRLQKMLNNTDWRFRQKAIVAVSRTGKRGALPILMDGLHDAEPEVRLTVVNNLKYFDTELILEHLSVALYDEDRTVGQLAAKKLVEIGEAALSILKGAATSSDEDVRSLAIHALGQIGDDACAAILLESLSDHAVPSWTDQSIGELASAALLKLKANDVQAVVVDPAIDENIVSLSETEEEISSSMIDVGVDALTPDLDSFTAVQTSSEVQQPEQQEYLIQLRDLIERLQGDEWRKRHKAAKELNKLAKSLRGRRNKVVADKISLLLSSSDNFVRLTAAEAVAWLADESAIPLLVPMLQEENDYTIQIAAMRALAEISERRVVPHIVPLLNAKNQLVREVAAEVLGYLHDKAAVPALLEALKESTGFFRRGIIQALGDIGNLQAVPQLIDYLSDQDPQVRWATAEALGKIGAPEAISDLKRLLWDSYEVPYVDEFGQTTERHLSGIVVRALENIGTKEAKEAIADWESSHA